MNPFVGPRILDSVELDPGSPTKETRDDDQSLNLLSADVVTADGSVVQATAQDNPDLFWAIWGGGGNFSVISSFRLRLHPVGPQVLSGLIVHPVEDAPRLLREFRAICAEADDELTVWAVLRKAPPLPFLPLEWHGREVLIFAACHVGEMARGETSVGRLRGLGEPIADVIGPQTFTGWQAAFDSLLRARGTTGRATISSNSRTRRSTFSWTRPAACPIRNAKSR